jgi:hemolysin III
MIAMSFRTIDGRALIKILPMGTHWLWHSFGAAAVQFLVLYIWRSDLRENGRQACCKV